MIVLDFLRHGLWNAARGDGGDDLLPDQGSRAEENAPGPLLQGKGRGGKRGASELDYENLQEEDEP